VYVASFTNRSQPLIYLYVFCFLFNIKILGTDNIVRGLLTPPPPLTYILPHPLLHTQKPTPTLLQEDVVKMVIFLNVNFLGLSLLASLGLLEYGYDQMGLEFAILSSFEKKNIC